MKLHITDDVSIFLPSSCFKQVVQQLSEAVVWRCSVGKVFLEISQNSQENTCARVSFLIKLQAWAIPVNFAKFLRTPFFYRTPPVAASELYKVILILEYFLLKYERGAQIDSPEKTTFKKPSLITVDNANCRNRLSFGGHPHPSTSKFLVIELEKGYWWLVVVCFNSAADALQSIMLIICVPGSRLRLSF